MVREKDVWAALPSAGFLRSFCQFCHVATDAPLAFALGAGLGALATFAPDFSFWYGTEVYPTWWALLVGDSAETRKTTVVKIAERVIGAIDPAKILPNPESASALFEAMQLQPQSVFLQPEMGDFFAGTTKGSYKAAVREKMMALYDGSRMTKHKVGEILVVERPRLSVLGGVAPPFLEAYAGGKDWQDGNFSRYYMVYAERERTYEPPPSAPDGLGFVTYELMSLSRLAPRIGPCLGWKPGVADVYWAQQCEGLDALCATATTSRWARSSFARSRNTALKAAMLYDFDVGNARDTAVHAPGEGWYLSKAAIDFGMAVARMHIASVQSILSLLSHNFYEHQRKEVLGVFADNNMHTLGWILRAVKPRMKKRDLEQVLETLVAAGELFYIPAHLHGHSGYYWNRPPPVTQDGKSFTFDEDTGEWC